MSTLNKIIQNGKDENFNQVKRAALAIVLAYRKSLLDLEKAKDDVAKAMMFGHDISTSVAARAVASLAVEFTALSFNEAFGVDVDKGNVWDILKVDAEKLKGLDGVDFNVEVTHRDEDGKVIYYDVLVIHDDLKKIVKKLAGTP